MLSLIRLAIVTTICTLAVGLLALLAAVRFGPAPNWWPLLALDTFALFAFAPFVGVAAAALVFWSRPLAIVSAVAALLFLQQFSGPLLSGLGVTGPSVVSAGEGRQRLRILTLNLHSPGEDTLSFVELVRRTEPDVVVLQEVSARFEPSFDRQIGAQFPFSVRVATHTDHEGSGTWSRYPLLDPQTLRVSPWGNTMHRVRLSTGRGEIWLYNIHLPNPTGENREDGKVATVQRFRSELRDYEFDWLAGETAGLELPYILAGDFNIGAGSYAYRRFPAAWQDAHALAGRGFGHTFPAPAHGGDSGINRYLEAFPWIRIDYVLTSPQIQPVRAWREELTESDHFALIVDLEF